jgi:hypothetical protein
MRLVMISAMKTAIMVNARTVSTVSFRATPSETSAQRTLILICAQSVLSVSFSSNPCFRFPQARFDLDAVPRGAQKLQPEVKYFNQHSR